MDIGFLVFGAGWAADAGLFHAAACRPPSSCPIRVLLALVGCLLGNRRALAWMGPARAGATCSTPSSISEISSGNLPDGVLPVLLFETALSMNVRRLIDDIGPILMMADRRSWCARWWWVSRSMPFRRMA